MKRSLRMILTGVAVLMCMVLLVSCATAPLSTGGYADGELGTNKAEGNGSGWGGWLGGASKDDAMYAPEAPGASAPSEGDYESGGVGGGFEQQAGQLTGSEWNDNDHFSDFVEKLRRQGDGGDGEWYKIANNWGMVATQRIHVRVQQGDAPTKLAQVVLLDAAGDVLWRAVSDADGDAYLFYNIGKSEQLPASVTAMLNGTQVSASVSAVNEDGVLVLELAAQTRPTKLDVMFMIDTTGSMGDELEYLKAEMGDVIRRVASESGVSVRTSVNFYRDEGDEYKLRYFDFRENVDDAVELLSEQRAAGGGDYEEAVDTALNYAINTQVWDEDAVKLMFLVLDAPPHETPAAIETIGNVVRRAAEQGIRIIPVASSGVDTTCQVLFRTWATLTGGTYTYLTDHSGIGGSHDKPEVEQVNVELLNNMLIRIIKEYCK